MTPDQDPPPKPTPVEVVNASASAANTFLMVGKYLGALALWAVIAAAAAVILILVFRAWVAGIRALT